MPRPLRSCEAISEPARSPTDKPADYGLGLMNPADGYAQGVGHMGANFGYNSWAACLTEDHLIVVVLTNFDADIFNLGRPLVMAARSD